MKLIKYVLSIVMVTMLLTVPLSSFVSTDNKLSADELGDGDGEQFTTAVMISAGVYHSLALKNDGTVWAWGDNSYGKLGDGTTTRKDTAVQVKLTADSYMTGIIAVEAANEHSVALDKDGHVWTWGYNYYGQLGNGTTTNSSYPVQVLTEDGEPLSGITAISASGNFSLALDEDGNVWGWGYNYYGQLGIITETSSIAYAIKVAGIQNVVAISASRGDHSIALDSDGYLWAWGQNSYGQLGDGYIGTDYHRATPAKVMADPDNELTGVVSFSAGVRQSAVLMADGTVWAWGWNNYGQLGIGNKINQAYPVQVVFGDGTPLTGIRSIEGGSFGMTALDNDGNVWTWGDNEYGQLGIGSIGTATSTLNPIQAVKADANSDLGDIIAISNANAHVIALKSDGSVWTWGRNNYGQLGNSTYVNSGYAVQALTATKYISVAAGMHNTYAVKADGTLWAWGMGSGGRLGNGTTTTSTTPVQVIKAIGVPLTGIVAVEAGENYAVALDGNGNVWAWGDNYYGELGNKQAYASMSSSSVAVQVVTEDETPLSDITSIKTVYGSNQIVALKIDGTVWTWGWNSSGQLGDGSTANSNFAVQVINSVDDLPLNNIKAVTTGTNHMLALDNDGRLWAWGNNSSSQLGIAGNVNQAKAVLVTVFEDNNITIDIVGIAAGGNSSYVSDSDGHVWAWGYNGYGRLGNGGTADTAVPTTVKTGTGANDILSNIVSISATHETAAAVDTDGHAWIWGFGNQYGNLAQGSNMNSSVAVKMKVDTGADDYLEGAVSVALSTQHTIVLTSDGSFWGAGRGDYGRLGNGSETTSNIAVQVSASNMDLNLYVYPISSAIEVHGEGDATETGDTLQMIATVSPSEASQNVTWSVEDGTGRATISDNGLLTAISDGTVTVIATAKDGSGVTGECIITIKMINTVTVTGAGDGGSYTYTVNDGSPTAVPPDGQITVSYGATLVVTSVPNEGYSFTWNDGFTGTLVVSSDLSLSGTFTLNTYTITGTVSFEIEYTTGSLTSVYIEYKLDGIQQTAVNVGTDGRYTITVPYGSTVEITSVTMDGLTVNENMPAAFTVTSNISNINFTMSVDEDDDGGSNTLLVVSAIVIIIALAIIVTLLYNRRK